MIPEYTPGLRRLCEELLAAEDRGDHDAAEIVCDGNECWIGLRRTNWATIFRGLRLCLFRHDEGGGSDHFTLNEDGRAIARDPNHIPRFLEKTP